MWAFLLFPLRVGTGFMTSSSTVALRVLPQSALQVSCSLHLLLCSEECPLNICAARVACETQKAAAPSSSSSSPPLLHVHGAIVRKRSMGGVTFLDLSDGLSTLQVVVCQSDLTLAGGLCGLALQLVLRLHSAIGIEGIAGVSRSGEPSLLARSLRLLSLPADPAALLKAARLLASTSDLPADVAAEALGCQLEELYEVVHAIEAADGTEREAPEAANQLARSLASRIRRYRQQQQQQQQQQTSTGAAASSSSSSVLLAQRGRRERPPRFSVSELGLLRQLSATHTEWSAEHTASLAPLWEVASALQGPLAPECGLPSGLAPAEREVRLTYYRDKKVPQLRWMLRQAKQLVEARAASAASAASEASAASAASAVSAASAASAAQGARAGTEDRPLRVVDLGCGKGDFALLLAAAMPSLSVVGVDTNSDAIRYAESRAAEAGLTNTTFRTADAAELDGGCGDVLVALHACGGLSDVALALAARCGASCLICTCCFNKHRGLCPSAHAWALPSTAEKDVLCRMADCVEPDISAEARRVVSSLRLDALRRRMRPDRTLVRASIRTFPVAYSRQNVVLCGECSAT